MVDFMTLGLFMMVGLGVYLVVIPFIALTQPPAIRKRVGDHYAKAAARLLEQFTYVRRLLSGYDVLPIGVQAEKKLLKVTLASSSIPGKSDKTYRFANPDDRIKRLFKKPVALNYEKVPAAVDAVLAELGHWVREKDTAAGLNRGKKVDPYIPMSEGLHIADPLDAYEIVPNSVSPENITTTEKLTERRFEKYGQGVGLRESLAGVMGFFTGAGGVVLIQYVRDTLMHGGGGGPNVPTNVPLGMIVDLAVVFA